MVNWEDQAGSEFMVVFLTQGAAKPSYACKIRVKRCAWSIRELKHLLWHNFRCLLS